MEDSSNVETSLATVCHDQVPISTNFGSKLCRVDPIAAWLASSVVGDAAAERKVQAGDVV